MRRRALFLVSVFLTLNHAPCFGQDEQNITLAEAEKIAIQNHPQIQVATYLFGGQGTINVPSWSPDSKMFAFVSYQLIP